MENLLDIENKKKQQSIAQALVPAQNPILPVDDLSRAPASQAIPMQRPVEMQPNVTPPGNWAKLASAPAQNGNSIQDAFQTANQITALMPKTGDQAQMKAVAGIGDAQSKGFDEQSKIIDEQSKNLEVSQENLKNIQKQKETEVADFEKKMEESLKDLKDSQIDSERLWNNKTTGNKILTAIGMALSVLGGPEAVARTNQIIQGQIDQDIEDQKAAYALKKDAVGEQKGVYAKMLDKFQDKEKAELATQAYYLKLTQNKIDSLGARTNSTVAKENAKMQAGQIQSKLDGISAQLGVNLLGKSQEQSLKADKLIPNDYTPRDEEERKRFVRGVGLTTDPESAKALRVDLANFNQFNDKMSELISLREKFGSETLPSEAKGIMKQLATEALLAKKASAKLGVMSDSDRSLLEAIVADPTSFNPNTLGRMKGLQKSTLSDFSRNVQPSLLNPVESFGVNLRKGSF